MHDPLSRVDRLCGGPQATNALRSAIAEHAQMQAKHFMGMNNPAWVDKAINEPDWAKGELLLCSQARAKAVHAMESQLATLCEKIALKDIAETGTARASLLFSLTRGWDRSREIGSNAARDTVLKSRGIPPGPQGLIDPQHYALHVDKDYSPSR